METLFFSFLFYLAARDPSPVLSGTDVFAECFTLSSKNCRHFVIFKVAMMSVTHKVYRIGGSLERNPALNKIVPNKIYSSIHHSDNKSHSPVFSSLKHRCLD